MSGELNDRLQDSLKVLMGYVERGGCGSCVYRPNRHSTCELNPAVGVKINTEHGTCKHQERKPPVQHQM